jgi:hypothetical protein
MTQSELLKRRLTTHHLASPDFKNASEVVRWFGAVQAQDFFASLWAVGQRLTKAVEADVERAIAEKQIVRSYPMRGTLHFTPPEDLRWMLKLMTPRIVAKSAKIYRDASLNAAVFKKSASIFERALQGENQLTRDEMYEVLEEHSISTKNYRGLHILGHLSQQGLLCYGPRKGKQQTFVLLDEWIPGSNDLTRDESLARLTLNYFTGHGPATLQDLVWWSGLTVADIKAGIEMVKSKLAEETIDGVTYYFSPAVSSKKSSSAFLLPVYDEYTVAYKDRDILLDEKAASSLKKINNLVFTNTIVIGGGVVGVWRRTIKKEKTIIEVNPLITLNTTQKEKIEAAAKKYGKFIGLKPEVIYTKKFSYK